MFVFSSNVCLNSSPKYCRFSILINHHSANVFEQLRWEIGRDSSSTQSLLLPTVRLHVDTHMEERTFNSAIGHEQYGFEPGIESGFEAMVG